jgi:DNA-binding LacI/PurR family transcriptional regulator
VAVPREEIGRRAARMIVRRLAGDPDTSAVVDVGYEIRVRESA